MPFYLTWIYKKGHRTKIFFRVSTLFSNNFAPHIQNLETRFWIFVYFDFGYVWDFRFLCKYKVYYGLVSADILHGCIAPATGHGGGGINNGDTNCCCHPPKREIHHTGKKIIHTYQSIQPLIFILGHFFTIFNGAWTNLAHAFHIESK